MRGFAISPGTWTEFDLGDGKPPVRAKLLRTRLARCRQAAAEAATRTRWPRKMAVGSDRKHLELTCADGSMLGVAAHAARKEARQRQVVLEWPTGALRAGSARMRSRHRRRRQRTDAGRSHKSVDADLTNACARCEEQEMKEKEEEEEQEAKEWEDVALALVVVVVCSWWW